MKWFVPREHGAWAMLVVPFMLGMLASDVTFLHLIFFIGILALYFASGPLLAYIRKPKLKKEIIPSLGLYLGVGLLFTSPILYLLPNIIFIGLCIIPFFLLNVLFAKLKKERLFVNDLFAIIGLSFLVIISYYIGSGKIDEKVLMLMGINIIFFTASVFHVKTLIREKGNVKFLWGSNLFHGAILIVFIITGLPIISITFLVSSLKTWLMPRTKNYKPIQIGLIEIANSVVFVVLIGIFSHLA